MATRLRDVLTTKDLPLHGLPCLVLLLAGCAAVPRLSDRVRHIQPNDETASSMATVVVESALVHTDQLFPTDAAGRLIGASDPAEQVRRTMENLRVALRLADADVASLAKLNVYLAADSLRDVVEGRLAQELAGEARPAVTYVTTAMPRPDVLVAIDAVAAAPAAGNDGSVSRLRGESLFGSDAQAQASIMPAGPKVYISGQAERGEPLDAVGRTMRGLHATLAHLGLSARDVVQVKAFINSMSDAPAVEKTIEEYFREKPAPPIVTTEWRQDAYPAEIEVVAAGSRADAAPARDPLTFITPPWLSSSPLFSRVVEVDRGDLVFVSGLSGTPGDEDAVQVEQAFNLLGEVLERAGSDLEHMAKATYYFSSDAAGGSINDVRTERYHPERPPAASKIAVRGVGRPGSIITLDMIAVAPE